MSIIVLLAIGLLLYLILKLKAKPPTVFEQFLMNRHIESEKRASYIPSAKPDNIPAGQSPSKNVNVKLPWHADLYLGMITSNNEKYNIDDLRLEACQALNITQEYLDTLLENYKKISI